MPGTPVNPDSLHTSPFYAQGMVTEGGRTLYIGGQNGTDADGVIAGDLVAQSVRAAKNVRAVVEAAGGSVDDIVKLTVAMVATHDEVPAAAQASIQALDGCVPTITAYMVTALGRPEALVEIDGIAHLA